MPSDVPAGRSSDSPDGGYDLDIVARCPICEADHRMVARGPWLRDQLVCPGCGSIPRHRALMQTLNMCFPSWREAVMHEAAPVWHAASAKFHRECHNYSWSYFDPDAPLGEPHPQHGWRNENLEDLRFPAASFDIFVTQDVLEHVFRPDRVVSEIARVLRPGGIHICTVPIVNADRPSSRRARMTDGRIEYLEKPQYHGNPVNKGGSLVTIDWGYDIASHLDHWSGLSTTIVYIDDLTRGIRAQVIDVLVMRKINGLPSL